MTGWRLSLLSVVLLMAGVVGGLSIAQVSRAPIMIYGSVEFWQRQSLSYLASLREARARVVKYDELVRAGKREAPQ